MQKIFIIIAAAIFIFSCKSVKKVEAIHNVIAKKDTAQTIIVAEVSKVDSESIVKGIMEKVMRKKIDFTTFNSKVKVDYEGSENSIHVTGYISILKDSIIYIKITHPVLGLVFQIQIANDSILIVDMKKKYTEKKAITAIQEITKIPFNFSTLQDALVGNPIFLDSNVVSFKNNATQLLVLMVGDVFKHLLTMENSNFRVLHSKLDDVDAMRNRTCDITFSNYQTINNRQFATYRQISVSEKSKLDVYLDFKETSFNDPLKYVFSIPKNFRRK